MGWHKLFMKYGIGSPGYIARRMAKRYIKLKNELRSSNEQSIIYRLFVERIAAQTSIGGPTEYHFLKQHASVIDKIVESNPDLFSIIVACIIIEHPELAKPNVPPDTFELLSETIREVLNSSVPNWRNAGVWNSSHISCQLCDSQISEPNPANMYVTLEPDGKPAFFCETCALPLHIRAISVLGFIMENSS